MRFAGLAVLVVLGLGPAGCAAWPDWNAVAQQAVQLRAGCESQYTGGQIKTHLAAEQCANPSIHNLYGAAGWPDMDVLDAYLARRESIAEQWDRKAITPEEARAQFAQAFADENTTLEHRTADRATTAAALSPPYPMFCTHVVRGTMICQ